MRFKIFASAAKKERSDRVAHLLTRAGIRVKQRLTTKAGRRLYVITVHPDDVNRAHEVQSEATRLEREEFVRALRFVRQPYTDQDMLLALEPNEAGYHVSGVYRGEPFDETKFRLVRGGWDHEHCYLCWGKVLPGDEWWVTHPPHYENEIGLCLDCYLRLFGRDSTEPGAAPDRGRIPRSS